MTDASGLNAQMPAGSQADMPTQQGMPGGMQVGSLLASLHFSYVGEFFGVFVSGIRKRARCYEAVTSDYAA